MKSDNLNDDLQVEANKNRLIIEPKVLREYFGIEYQENLGNILHQFTEYLGGVIPLAVPEKTSTIEKNAMIQSLSKSDSEGHYLNTFAIPQRLAFVILWIAQRKMMMLLF